MKIEATTPSMLTITGAPNLDPIRVITENYQPGQGRIVIQCWDRAWAAAWMGMNGRTVEQFFIACDWDYLLSNLTNGLHGLRQDAKKRDKEYVRRIIEAVQAAFRARASTGDQVASVDSSVEADIRAAAVQPPLASKDPTNIVY